MTTRIHIVDYTSNMQSGSQTNLKNGKMMEGKQLCNKYHVKSNIHLKEQEINKNEYNTCFSQCQ